MAKASSISRQMNLKNVFYKLDKLDDITKLAEKALEIDPDHVIALLVLAQRRARPPKLFGGDVKKAIEILLKVNNIHEMETGERFTTLYNLAMAYEKDKNRKMAEMYLERALKIYPGNQMAVTFRQEEMK